jgi:Rrf2 family protein
LTKLAILYILNDIKIVSFKLIEMKLITKNTDYAFRAISYIARKGDKTTVGEMSNELKVPKPFLRGILQELNKNGLLRSFKGSGGGFALAQSPDKILFTDLMQIFQGPLKISECKIRKKSCPDIASCRLKSRIESMKRTLESELKSITLASLL